MPANQAELGLLIDRSVIVDSPSVQGLRQQHCKQTQRLNKQSKITPEKMVYVKPEGPEENAGGATGVARNEHSVLATPHALHLASSSGSGHNLTGVKVQRSNPEEKREDPIAEGEEQEQGAGARSRSPKHFQVFHRLHIKICRGIDCL